LDGDSPLMSAEVDGGAGQVPEAADAGQAILPPGGGGGGPPYLFRLVGAKGRSARHRWSSSSLSMVSSPTFARSRAISSSRSSVGRLFSAAWPPARKSSRHPDRVAAVTPSSRETSSRSSPRRSRRTVAVLRWEEKRPRSPEFGALDMNECSWVWAPMMSQRDVQRNPGAEDGAAAWPARFTLGRYLVVPHNMRSVSEWLFRELSAPEHPMQGAPAPPDRDPTRLAVALAAQEASQARQ